MSPGHAVIFDGLTKELMPEARDPNRPQHTDGIFYDYLQICLISIEYEFILPLVIFSNRAIEVLYLS